MAGALFDVILLAPEERSSVVNKGQGLGKVEDFEIATEWKGVSVLS